MGMNKEQVKKINEKAGNNFKFDIQFYMFHKEKQFKNSNYYIQTDEINV